MGQKNSYISPRTLDPGAIVSCPHYGLLAYFKRFNPRLSSAQIIAIRFSFTAPSGGSHRNGDF